jgi:protein-disulfide isomerase
MDQTGEAGGRGSGGAPGFFDRWKVSIAACTIGLAIGAAGVALATGALSGASAERAEIEGMVRDYLLEHPEILPEAMERLQQREVARAVGENRAALETPFHGAWAGSADPDVVLVEFYDYACGFCRASNADLDRLLREDPKLRVVWREWPVLGPDSEAASVASLAAAQRGRFKPFYDALFASGRPTPANVEQALRAVGIDPAEAAAYRSSPEVAAELQRNQGLARTLGATGTPLFMVGDQILSGAVGYEALREAISKAREQAES